MELNVQTEANALKMQMDSGISLNMQIPSPISMKVTGVVYGGGGGADIEAIEELIDESTTTINAHTTEERETIMGGGTGGTADNVIDTQGLLIPGFKAVSDGQTYYLAGFYIDSKVGAMPFQANEVMYTGALNVGTCLRTDDYADIVTQALQPDQIAALAIPIATTGDPYADEFGDIHNVVTEPMTLGKVYRLKSIVPVTYNDPEEEITSFDLYVWEEAQSTGRNIAETYNLVQETSQTIIEELGNIDFEPLEQKIDTATENIMGGKKVTHSMDNLPAAQCGTDNSDFRPVAIGDADYTLTDEYAFAISNGLAVGNVIRVLADNSGDGHEPMAVPKTINEASLAIVAYSSLPTIDGVTEWLQFEQHKHYIVTGIHETEYDGYTWFVYTFDEYEPGRSSREVYDKVEEVKTAVENINVESADQVAQFLGLPQALPQYTYATDQEVIDIVDEVYHDYFPTTEQTTEQTEQASEQNNNND